MKTVFIALGGNLGEVREHFIAARSDIDRLQNTSVSASSLLYRTPPVGPAGQPDYLNAVIRIQTDLDPLALLDALQQIENRYGRERLEHWGARTLDLDIIAIASDIITSERLVIPHPHMFDRQFVLQPLCDLAPQWQHPQLGESATHRLKQIIETGEAPLPEGEAW
ncbi:2-amino-4-hydroxy-6-hydroxymethyldihydropteridine diphosphokinase [Mariprofundus micogutta]|uniref:2-amino-4-hydroxy-6-hydroxymethyldihydropteridine pyrophosphokinase n=1 Tax=Mariprofundus micogutta TaxID=1921010 RepID=A0A1L8CKS9_9PROT|nr:2-amino-4-hydroxy-6-hydroxymethyldihydropteridine diphosphokinase [Mariprofundus micogutta]GAV19510.1 2-amino-4-hydroxy-6-hydroxymethyldihydropteridine diphosphokinase [Mariprofundus micogutta]